MHNARFNARLICQGLVAEKVGAEVSYMRTMFFWRVRRVLRRWLQEKIPYGYAAANKFTAGDGGWNMMDWSPSEFGTLWEAPTSPALSIIVFLLFFV